MLGYAQTCLWRCNQQKWTDDFEKTHTEYNNTGGHIINDTALKRAHATPDACEQVADYAMLLAY